MSTKQFIETYALGLLGEEAGEISQMTGKAHRFGIDSPHPSKSASTRQLIAKECGDVMAAIDYAIKRGVLSGPLVQHQRETKLKKLLDPESKDSLGRRLAP